MIKILLFPGYSGSNIHGLDVCLLASSSIEEINIFNKGLQPFKKFGTLG